MKVKKKLRENVGTVQQPFSIDTNVYNQMIKHDVNWSALVSSYISEVIARVNHGEVFQGRNTYATTQKQFSIIPKVKLALRGLTTNQVESMSFVVSEFCRKKCEEIIGQNEVVVFSHCYIMEPKNETNI